MARTKRDDLKRKVAQAFQHTAGAIVDLNVLHEAYKEHHPDEADRIALLMHNVNECSKEILALAKRSWDIDDEQLMAYL